MMKQILLAVLLLGSLTACYKSEFVTGHDATVSKDKERAASTVYRGLMYGKLEQIKPHVSVDLYEILSTDSAQLKHIRSTIPKQEILEKEVYATKSKMNLLLFKHEPLEVVYHYKYADKIVVYTVYYDHKTSQIVEFTIQNTPILVVE